MYFFFLNKILLVINMNILITGSASGLGYNAGINLAREGYHVFLTTENDKQLEVLNDKVKNMNNIDTFKLDVTNKNDLKNVIDENNEKIKNASENILKIVYTAQEFLEQKSNVLLIV